MRRRLKLPWARRERRARKFSPHQPEPVSAGLLDAFADALVLTDPELAVTQWNAAAARLTGLPPERAIGRKLPGLAPVLDTIGLPERLAQLLDRRDPADPGDLTFTRLVNLPGAEGGAAWIEVRCAVTFDGGRRTGAAAFLRDVTASRQRAVFVNAMEAIGRSLTSSLDLNEVLDTIAARAREVMAADSVLVVAWDGQAPTAQVLRAAGRLSGGYATDGTIPIAGGPMSRALLERQVFTTTNVLNDPVVRLDAKRRAQVAREGFKAVAAAPLASKGRVHGALVVHYWTERSFAEEEARALGLMAEQAAIAIDNARVYADARRRAERLRELAEVERVVAESLDLDVVLGRIVDATARLLGAPVVHLFTVEPGPRALRLRAGAVAAEVPKIAMRATLDLGEGITGRAGEQRRSIFVPDTSRDPRVVNADWSRHAGLGAILSVPLTSGDALLGVLTVRARREALESEEDQALVTSLAARAGLALRNAEAYAHAVHRATRLREIAAVSQSIAGSLDLAEVMPRIARAAAALRPGALATVHSYDAERQLMRFAAYAGDEVRGLPDERPAGVGLPGLVFERRAPVLVEDPLTHPRTLAPEWWRARGGATYYGVPILVGETFMGVLDFILPDGVPDAEEQEALSLLAAHAGLAIRNASLYEVERVQADRAEVLAAIGQRLSSALDLDALLRTIADSAATLTGVRYASFWLADDDRRTLTIVGGSVASIAADFPVTVAPYGTGYVGWVAEHRQSLVVDDVFVEPRVLDRDWWERWDLRSIAAFPVMAGDRLVAVLALCHAEPLRVDGHTREIIEMFGAQASVAVQNARLYREAQRRREAAEALARIGRELTATLDVERLAERVAAGVLELVPALGVAVLRHGDDGSLPIVAAQGAEAQVARGAVLKPGEGMTGLAIAERGAVSTPDLLADPRVALSDGVRRILTAHRYRSAAAAPMLTGERIVGAIAVGAEAGRIFTEDEMRVLQSVADQAALAFENARLYASARESLERLRETQSQLVQAGKMTALGQLVSGVAHELNNPLSVIIGYGQLLLHRQIPEPYRHPVELMVGQADRMARIVRNLLFFARQRAPERVAVDVNQVIEQTLALRQHQLALSAITVERDLADLPTVTGDPQQLQQVFLNLVLNAEQAILAAKRGSKITFRTRRSGDGRFVRADVVDDGPGISPADLPHVFEPFFTTKEVGVGTGLGLSVSYGIVQEHDGTLTATSEPGHTVFTLELPVGVVAAVTGVPRPAVLAGLSSQARRALVVEDEPEVADLIQALLTEVGWRVDVAHGGYTGLDQVRQRSYDLIVTDLRMAEGDGAEFYRNAVMENPALKSRFVFMTGDLASPEAMAFLESVKGRVVEKPFAPGQFMEAVQQVEAARREVGVRL
jgi:PAS domain S-box-containing protein